MNELNLSNLSSDVAHYIRKIYFEMYVKPGMVLASWSAVQGCRNIRSTDTNFLSRAAHWASSYIHCFYPSIAMCEPRGVGIAYCEYIKTHKYCWVNIVDIEVVNKSKSASTIMTQVKLAFQNEFDCVQVNACV